MVKAFITINPGFYNKGDASLILGAIKILSGLGKAEITLLTRDPVYEAGKSSARLVGPGEKKGALHKWLSLFVLVQYLLFAALIRLVGLSRLWDRLALRKDIWRSYREADIIVAGLDDSFTTLYGPIPFVKNCVTIAISRLLGKKVVLLGSSIGPFKNRVYERIGRYALDLTDLITLREKLSESYIRSIGVKNSRVHVTADLAFALGRPGEGRVEAILEQESIRVGTRPIVGLSLSTVITHWAFEGVTDPQQKFKLFCEVMVGAVRHAIDTLGASVILIPHCVGPTTTQDDRHVHAALRASLGNRDHLYMIEREYSPEDLRGLIGKCDLFIGARTHAVISAAVTGTPFLALEYESFKTRGIIGEMLRSESRVIDVRGLSMESLIARMDDAWATRKEVRQHLKAVVQKVLPRVDENTTLLRAMLQS